MLMLIAGVCIIFAGVYNLYTLSKGGQFLKPQLVERLGKEKAKNVSIVIAIALMALGVLALVISL